MSHKGIRSLIEITAKSLGDNIEFTYARKSDFNVLRDKKYPFIALDPLVSVATFSDNNTFNYSKTWTANMAFYDLDVESSDGDQYREILDRMDDLIDKFITKLNFTSQDVDGIIITSINQQPFVKATADILTGFFLSFNIQVPDNWDYCRDC